MAGKNRRLTLFSMFYVIRPRSLSSPSIMSAFPIQTCSKVIGLTSHHPEEKYPQSIPSVSSVFYGAWSQPLFCFIIVHEMSGLCVSDHRSLILPTLIHFIRDPLLSQIAVVRTKTMDLEFGHFIPISFFLMEARSTGMSFFELWICGFRVP